MLSKYEELPSRMHLGACGADLFAVFLLEVTLSLTSGHFGDTMRPYEKRADEEKAVQVPDAES